MSARWPAVASIRKQFDSLKWVAARDVAQNVRRKGAGSYSYSRDRCRLAHVTGFIIRAGVESWTAFDMGRTQSSALGAARSDMKTSQKMNGTSRDVLNAATRERRSTRGLDCQRRTAARFLSCRQSRSTRRNQGRPISDRHRPTH